MTEHEWVRATNIKYVNCKHCLSKKASTARIKAAKAI